MLPITFVREGFPAPLESFTLLDLASASRVKASTTVKARNCRLLNGASEAKSISPSSTRLQCG